LLIDTLLAATILSIWFCYFELRRLIVSTSDPLASLEAEVATLAANEAAETTAINALIAYLQTVLAGAPPTGTVNVSVSELASALTSLQAIAATQVSNTSAATGAVPAAPVTQTADEKK
jgi:hypothetical protein